MLLPNREKKWKVFYRKEGVVKRWRIEGEVATWSPHPGEDFWKKGETSDSWGKSLEQRLLPVPVINFRGHCILVFLLVLMASAVERDGSRARLGRRRPENKPAASLWLVAGTKGHRCSDVLCYSPWPLAPSMRRVESNWKCLLATLPAGWLEQRERVFTGEESRQPSQGGDSKSGSHTSGKPWHQGELRRALWGRTTPHHAEAQLQSQNSQGSLQGNKRADRAQVQGSWD